MMVWLMARHMHQAGIYDPNRSWQIPVSTVELGRGGATALSSDIFIKS